MNGQLEKWKLQASRMGSEEMRANGAIEIGNTLKDSNVVGLIERWYWRWTAVPRSQPEAVLEESEGVGAKSVVYLWCSLIEVSGVLSVTITDSQ